MEDLLLVELINIIPFGQRIRLCRVDEDGDVITHDVWSSKEDALKDDYFNRHLTDVVSMIATDDFDTLRIEVKAL